MTAVHEPPCLSPEEHAGCRIVEQKWWPPVLDDDVDRWRREWEQEAREAAEAYPYAVGGPMHCSRPCDTDPAGHDPACVDQRGREHCGHCPEDQPCWGLPIPPRDEAREASAALDDWAPGELVEAYGK